MRKKALFALAVTVSIFLLPACKSGLAEDGQPVRQPASDSGRQVLVFYAPDSLGDSFYTDMVSYGVHLASVQPDTGFEVLELSPESWEGAEDSLAAYLSDLGMAALADSTATAPQQTLFLFADPGYQSLILSHRTDFARYGLTALLLEADESEEPFLSTIALPMYGVSYLAGLAAKELLSLSVETDESPRVIAVLANDTMQSLLDALQGFTDGYQPEDWQGAIYDYSGSSTLSDEESDLLLEGEFAVIKLAPSENDSTGFNSSSALYDAAVILNLLRPVNLFFPVCGSSIAGLLRYNRIFPEDSFYTVGMDRDCSPYTDRVPFSVVKHIDTLLAAWLETWAAGGAVPHNQRSGLESGGVELVFSASCPEAVRTAVEAHLAEAMEKEAQYEKKN